MTFFLIMRLVGCHLSSRRPRAPSFLSETAREKCWVLLALQAPSLCEVSVNNNDYKYIKQEGINAAAGSFGDSNQNCTIRTILEAILHKPRKGDKRLHGYF